MKHPAASPWLVLKSAASAVHPESTAKALFRRARFLWRSWQARSLILPALTEPSEFQSETLTTRPQALGLIEWPYLHSEWSLQQRLEAFRTHHDLVDQLPLLRVPVGQRRDLCDLTHVEPGLRLVLDRPIWFLREGEICLNLFLKETRIYTVAFNVEHDAQGGMRATVGGVQGRSIEGAREIYAHLTKALHGARPRDFLIAVLLMLCQQLGIQTIRGISDRYRHHRSSYFAGGAEKTQTADYDEIWSDRGGELHPDGFFHLAAVWIERSLEEIPSKKRAMYRRRSEMYAEIRQQVGLAAEVLNPDFLPQLPG